MLAPIIFETRQYVDQEIVRGQKKIKKITMAPLLFPELETHQKKSLWIYVAL